MNHQSKGAGSAGINVLIPALNEMDNLQDLVPRIHAVMEKSGLHDYEIVVVVESSALDSDLALLESLDVRALRRQYSDSFGNAVRTGISAASGARDVTVFMDADGSHDPETIPSLIDAMADHDIAISSRYVAGGSSENNYLLRSMSRSLNIAYRVILGLDCHDVSTSFKAYHTGSLKTLELTCENFDIVEEILVRLSRNSAPGHLRIKEIPDRFHARQHGQSKRKLGPFVASYLWTLYRLRRYG